MKTTGLPALVAALVVALAGTVTAAQSAEPQVKLLAAPKDPTSETVLVGRASTGDMIIQLELEPAKPMWMAMTASVQLELDQSQETWVVVTTPPQWGAHALAEGDLYHIEVKPIDPISETRIPYASVKFEAVNKDNGQRFSGKLHSMWGGSGLHYAINGGLMGDGTYEAVVTVGVPTFARDMKDRNRWMEPAKAKFHFRLLGGKLVEVSEPSM